MTPAFSLRNSFFYLFILFIIAIPINNSHEVLAMMKGELPWGGWSYTLTPIYLKLIKDCFIVSAFLLALIKAAKSPKIIRIILTDKRFILINFFFLAFILVSISSFFYMPSEYVLFGIRGYWSILLIYVGACFYDIDERNVWRAVRLVFLFHITIQAAQSILGSGYPVYGEFRSPGIFMIPATAGAFSILAYHFAESFKDTKLKVLAVFSLILSASTTGLLVFASYLLFKLIHRLRKHHGLLPFAAIFASAVSTLIILNLDTVSGRGDAVYSSFMIRAGYVSAVLSDFSNLAFGKGMGIATSQAVMSGLKGAVIADNTYTGAMLNIGWIAATVLLAFIVSSFLYFKNKLLFFLLIGYSMTTVIFELNPIIQFLMILLGMRMMQQTVSCRPPASRFHKAAEPAP